MMKKPLSRISCRALIPAGSPKTGNTALPWLFIGAAAISLTVAVLINRRPAQEA